jgi:Tfp pilus assembly protein PilF
MQCNLSGAEFARLGLGRMVALALSLAILAPCLVSCSSEEPAVETKKVKKRKKKRAQNEQQDMLSSSKMTLGEAARRFVPPARFNEGTPLTDVDYVNGAEEALHLHDDESAMTLASEAIRLNPKNGEAYYLRGRARFGGLAGDDQAPIDDLKMAVKFGAGGSGAWHYLARAYDAQKDFPHAIEAIGECIKMRSDDQAAFKTRATIYAANGEKEKAIADYTAAIKMKPQDAEVYFQRAQMLETMKRFDEALASYDAAVLNGRDGRQMPYKLMSLKRQAEIYRERGDYKKSQEVLTKGISMDNADEELLRLRGGIFEKLGRYEEAIADYSKAISMSPDYSRGSFEARGRCYEKIGKTELAARDQQEAQRLMDKPAEKPLYDLKGGSD